MLGLLLGACGGGGDGATGPGGNPLNCPVSGGGTDTFSLLGTPYTEGSINTCDPIIWAQYDPVATETVLYFWRNFSGSQYGETLALGFAGQVSGPLTAAAYLAPGTICGNGTGSVTISAYGLVGQPITGSYSITGFGTTSGACPASMTGAFSITREADAPTLYSIETIPNASSAGGNDANVDLAVFDSGDLVTPIAQDNDGNNGGSNPPYYAKAQVALTSGQTIYIRIFDIGDWSGYYSIRIRTGAYLGGSSSGTVAGGLADSYEVDDTSGQATALVLDAVQDHSLDYFEEDWFVFTAP